MSWKLIIAGVEPTPEGLWAAATAHRLAQAAKARCLLVHAVRDVWSSPASRQITVDVDAYRDVVLEHARADMLDALTHAAPEADAWPLEVRVGRAARVLRDAARETGADLVVLGGKRHLAPARWFGGSTAHEAARIIETPLLAATLSGPRFRRVLGAVDLSAAADAVIQMAERIAHFDDAALRFVHVIEPPPFAGPTMLAAYSDDFVERDLETLNQSVWSRISLVRAERVVRHGPVRSTLAAEALQWKADLLVLGAHGRGWVDRLVLGSVTQGLLADLPCSTLVIPVHERLAAEATPALHDATVSA